MRILIVHNHYRNAGGEDVVVASEERLLLSRGHDVRSFRRSNADMRRLQWLGMSVGTLWNPFAYRQLRRVIREFRPHVAHFHNFFPMISPAGYYAARAEKVPVVQTLHNYRLMCLNSFLYRDDAPCEACIGKRVPYPGVRHGCYRESRALSAVVAAMVALHHALGTWCERIDTYIALTEFARRTFIAAGLPEEKISVKPNFLDPAPPPALSNRAGFALFVGRLSPEKGVRTLLEGWSQVDPRHRLRIVGDGPLSNLVQETEARTGNIEWLRWKSRDEVQQLMREASLLIFPSQWYEGFPMVIVEALAAGLPALASDTGGLPSLIEGSKTSFLFRTGDAADLANKAEELLSNRQLLEQTGRRARAAFEAKYTAEKNYQALMSIYESVILSSSSKG
jgi:glycosyltransferase involved in cell wall biosynthesis